MTKKEDFYKVKQGYKSLGKTNKNIVFRVSSQKKKKARLGRDFFSHNTGEETQSLTVLNPK